MNYLLVLVPGITVYLVGLVWGVVYALRHKESSLWGARLRQFGLILIYFSLATNMTYLIVTGAADPFALAAVAILLLYGLLHVYVVRRLRVPPTRS